MPSRILKESICTSDSIDQLSAFEETFFYRLIVNCDDYGRMDARPKILASKLFPLKDIRTTQIESALRALTSAELVILYSVGGKPFLQMKTWDRHQQIRAKKSKYPSPDDSDTASEIICNQLISDESKCPRNPIQSESNPNPNPKEKRAREDTETDERFERFWTAYPRHTAKQTAQTAFKKIAPTEELLQTMLTAIEKQKGSHQWSDPQFIPHPATWLNQRRWEDETPKATSNSGRVMPAQQYSQRDYSGADDGIPDWVIQKGREMGILGGESG